MSDPSIEEVEAALTELGEVGPERLPSGRLGLLFLAARAFLRLIGEGEKVWWCEEHGHEAFEGSDGWTCEDGDWLDAHHAWDCRMVSRILVDPEGGE
jgi:hypothetical protein